jgi:hypothetical protein
MNAERDLDRERRFLRAASPFAPPFREHASKRLAAGEEEYGDSWATRGIVDLLSEIAEECTDIGAWAALTEQALDQRVDLDSAEREAVAKALLKAARLSSFAYALVMNARRRLLEIESSNGHGR